MHFFYLYIYIHAVDKNDKDAFCRYETEKLKHVISRFSCVHKIISIIVTKQFHIICMYTDSNEPSNYIMLTVITIITITVIQIKTRY